MQSLATQLPLRLNPQDVYRFDNFYFQQPELKQLFIGLEQSECDFIYLWGHEPCGKTHLLLAATEHYSKRSLYLPLAELVETASPEILQSVEQLDLLCIDELDAIAGKADWQEALFHCFNRLQHSGCKLLVAATHNPATIAFTLADLRSRMATALVYQLDSLDDNSKQQALISQAKSRGLELPEDVAQYLLRHYSRDIKVLMSVLQRLDNASMVSKRRLTIPFIRQVLVNE
ncbi:MAG: DnaA regulatory inactivator Hda [Piscirickettsiaceae bacterium]|nr:DnaA regulatory inactivator Hda [Piscirickettsiaceae bacterium]